jgi:hypothetical protein
MTVHSFIYILRKSNISGVKPLLSGVQSVISMWKKRKNGVWLLLDRRCERQGTGKGDCIVVRERHVLCHALLAPVHISNITVITSVTAAATVVVIATPTIVIAAVTTVVFATITTVVASFVATVVVKPLSPPSSPRHHDYRRRRRPLNVFCRTFILIVYVVCVCLCVF